MSKSKTLLKDIGEFGLIGQIRKATPKDGRVCVGIGDDAAVIRLNAAKDILLTTDMLIEDRHFKLPEASPFEIGWKAMAVNISDVAAMGGLPTYAVVSVGLRKNLSVRFIKEIYRGLKAAAGRFHVAIVGGDTNRSDKIVISVALLGEVGRGQAVRRSGAKIGDILFVSGFLGGSYASKKHLKFTPRIKESQFLTKHFKINAMIDLSDGLASDARRIAEESGVGILLSKEAIPVSKGATLDQALTEGEDFELLFTLSPKEAARLTSRAPKSDLAPFHVVGKVVNRKRGIGIVGCDGKVKPLLKTGFDHFI